MALRSLLHGLDALHLLRAGIGDGLACPAVAGLGVAVHLSASTVPSFAVTVYVFCAVAPVTAISSRARIENNFFFIISFVFIIKFIVYIYVAFR